MPDIRIARLDPATTDWDAALVLILDAFAFMDGVIDPPSSAHRLSPDVLAGKAAREVALGAFAGDALVGCAFLDLGSGRAYLGKVAVDRRYQGAGIGRRLVVAAEAAARSAGQTSIELQTRIELTDNQAAFARLGFVEAARTAHPGYDRPTSVTMCKALA